MDWTAAAIVLATFGGPFAALEIQKRLDGRREKQRLKEEAFRTLMATRAFGHRTSAEHVQTLNRIDLTFSSGGTKDRDVLEAWNVYRNCLKTRESEDWNANQRMYKRREDAFWDLLYRMGEAVGYPFDRAYLKDSSYTPLTHDNMWRD